MIMLLLAMKKTLPPTYFLGALVAVAALHIGWPICQLLHFPWRLLGLVPLAAGVILNLLADRRFKEHETTVKPFETSNALVTSGVFAVSRNPMYLGMSLILLGIALMLGSLSPFAAVIALPIAFDRAFITPEENMLEDAFGDDFRDYRRRVRRWI